ncbi:hypothetical protein BWQ96_06652 [Gracilariopsis chorda]|uniref:Uncharacterized protein n=1 Tax=Gracilariopsis chorda TaxID=448386 RepID=A0A2V3INE2_9FLOR|nr:hypothetical protein BWQ96_06652 [Gracilariopsis chorda]|eukprot:PXF43595.1 hypothetical protein BWQ96_06652 [Gracilariopsis chorda]
MTITVAIRNMTSSELAWYSSPNQTPTSGLQVVEADLDEVVVRYANGPYPVPTSGGKRKRSAHTIKLQDFERRRRARPRENCIIALCISFLRATVRKTL